MAKLKRHPLDDKYQENWEEYYNLPFHIEELFDIKDAWNLPVFLLCNRAAEDEDWKTVIIMKINGWSQFVTSNHEWAIKGGSIYCDGEEALKLNTGAILSDGYSLKWKEAKEIEKGILEYTLRRLQAI